MSYKAWVAKQKGSQLEWVDWDPVPLGDHDVEVEITHCGLCHTDKHLVDNDWQVARYPLVCGHEGIGNVAVCGSQVRGLKVGDRIGIGFIRDSCGYCPNCTKGEDSICYNGYTGVMFGDNKNNGCFASKIRIKANFCFKIPDSMDSVTAAPLMCAGITVYSPLATYINRPGMKVGVLGIGGLGHIAVQMARHMGAHVIAFSTSADKEKEVLSHGAHEFVHIGDKSKMAKYKNTIEFFLNTAPVAVEYDDWEGMLVPGGKFCIVGIPPVNSIGVKVIPLVFNQKSVIGSIVGGRKLTQEMLQFCAVHKIKPQTEVWDFKNINAAIDHVIQNKARYRVVLKF